MFEKLWNYKKVNGILIDNLNNNYSESMKAEKIVALEDYMVISDDDQYDSLSEKGIHYESFLRAEKLYNNNPNNIDAIAFFSLNFF